MGFSSFLLFPFRRYFKTVDLSLKIDYVTIPNNSVVMILLFVFFIICVSGTFYCIINGAPIGGYTITELHEIVVSFVQLNTFNDQFTYECYVAILFGTLLALSFFCMYKVGEDKGDNWKISLVYKIGACSSLIWVFILLSFMKEKSSGFSFTINPVFSHKKARYSNAK